MILSIGLLITTYQYLLSDVHCFVPKYASRHTTPFQPSVASLSSSASTSTSMNLTPLPKGISPFEKSVSKNLDIQKTFRQIAKKAVDNAINDQTNTSTDTTTETSTKLLELEFPPLIGGSLSKSQFDDFDNIQELDSNKDWTMQFAPLFFANPIYKDGKTWLVFPDLKECEIAKKEWQGQLYQTATFTTIEEATTFLNGAGSYNAPWGAALANGMNSLMSKKDNTNNDSSDNNNDTDNDNDAGLLGDKKALDKLIEGENSPSALNLIIQPGNGGPVEDWINCEKIHLASSPDTTMVIVNGALDKVRDGYYPAVFFPKLAATVDRFYKKFETAFYLKPISDKGVYGWLFRVYPEVCILYYVVLYCIVLH
jgi:hypothetical protein